MAAAATPSGAQAAQFCQYPCRLMNHRQADLPGSDREAFGPVSLASLCAAVLENCLTLSNAVVCTG